VKWCDGVVVSARAPRYDAPRAPRRSPPALL